MGIFAFWQKETGAKRVAMETALRVHFVSFVMYIYGAKFQEHCFNISRDIAYSVFFTFYLQTIWLHHWSNLHNRKTSISPKRKKIFQKEKHHSSVFWKGFQISTNYFSLHRHFNNMGGWTIPCNQLTRELWLGCIERNLWITATHIPGKFNVLADNEWRHTFYDN